VAFQAAIDRQATVPVLIPAFNNPTYLRQILASLSRFPDLSVVVLDNDSSYGPMLQLYKEIESRIRIVRLGCNAGPWFAWTLCDQMPRYFCVTDPDIALNPDLPADFVRQLMRVTETYHIGKAGFALDLSDRERMLQGRFRDAEGERHIWEQQAGFWTAPLCDAAFADPLYLARVDTTFALYNRAYFDPNDPLDAIRVAGRFTCRHLPWYVDNGLPPDEERAYRAASDYSYYLGDRSPMQVRALFAQQDVAARIR
jgi:glycosyltransferase involved in cell wall biosynthesis